MSKVVIDGPLDNAMYGKSNVRVLYLMKQANSDEAGWSLAQLLSDQVIDPVTQTVKRSYPVWLNLARWSFLIQNTGEPTFGQVSAPRPELTTALKRSAVVNIMNELGGATTGPSDLLRAASRDHDVWAKQLEELSPAVVVCCGTFWVLDRLSRLPSPVEESASGMRYSGAPGSVVYLDFLHPGSRLSHAMMYAWLRETILELRDKMALAD